DSHFIRPLYHIRYFLWKKYKAKKAAKEEAKNQSQGTSGANQEGRKSNDENSARPDAVPEGGRA
ncbi:hypothetical protein SERLADRAFT_465746, partial [Serpula lacrymans var. lacrymans S7.9]